jgi:hypothetical protein
MGTSANVLVGDAEITIGVGESAAVIGYTTDGVTMTTRSTFADIKTDEVSGTLIRKLTDQEVEVTLNVAEATLANLAAAIPGCDLTGATISIGGSDLQEHRLTLVGTNPAGYPRLVVLTAVNPTGEVGTPFKKGDISIVPMTFKALVADTGLFGTIVDAAAAAPTLTVGADTKSSADGTEIELQMSAAMADPAGKHAEFWFTEADFGSTRTFSAVALKGGDNTVIVGTVSGAAITAGKALAVSYARGTVTSAALGLLASFSTQTVVARP